MKYYIIFQKKYHNWISQPHRHIVAVLEDLSSLRPSLDHILELLPRLQCRYYSISSSPKVTLLLRKIISIYFLLCTIGNGKESIVKSKGRDKFPLVEKYNMNSPNFWCKNIRYLYISILNQFFQANVPLSCNITIDAPVLQLQVVFPTHLCNVFLVRYLKNLSLFHHTEMLSK